jgi:hypothetical protein
MLQVILIYSDQTNTVEGVLGVGGGAKKGINSNIKVLCQYLVTQEAK